MKMFALAACAAVLVAVPAAAAPVDDAVATVTTTLDKFNGGDVAAFIAAHRDGAVIIDEFAPFAWGGSGSVQAWLDSYGKDAAAHKISDGRVDYGKPLQANSDGTSAYIVLPTVYRFKQDGKPMAGKSTMTFVMVKTGKEWKISSWSYAGATAVPE
ncbi:nuclear transport factor 2 family protein [Sphingomonas jaspsi]|uniref:nuclear transport factor 2 family protein n=1 Tax=Sphingomonas jaspsi TaxID=392409 RepID=UPI00055FC5EA|nr:nuclear transport factor 2 family protein [Sphingomonas jaspsi]